MKLNETKPFIKRLRAKLSDCDVALIEKAAALCIDAHKNQVRQFLMVGAQFLMVGS